MQSLGPTENGRTASSSSPAYAGSCIHRSGRKAKGSLKFVERWFVAHCHTARYV